MRLLGRANWWAPRSLARVYARYGIRESDGEPVPAATPGLAGAGRRTA
jgi:RND superfamily putative drug exporter